MNLMSLARLSMLVAMPRRQQDGYANGVTVRKGCPIWYSNGVSLVAWRTLRTQHLLVTLREKVSVSVAKDDSKEHCQLCLSFVEGMQEGQ